MAQALKKPKKKAVNGYKFPERLPQGEILTDISKKEWKLGPSIGKGGFGEIYSAQEASSKSSKFPFVIKVEPHENGPLFVEMHVYMKIARQADIENFKKTHKLKTFGMPAYLGSGSHEVGSLKYRFIVIEKFGTDIDKLRQQNGGILPITTVFQLAWQMIYVLEYIHSSEYVHADIKGTNILLGVTPETKNQAYLVDFGLATKYSKEEKFKPNPKKAHDGTIEYLSRDAHQGVPTRRGDLEILGYNILHWLCGKLPWDSKLSDPKLVQQMKEDSMSDITKFLNKCFNNTTVPNGLVQFLKYVTDLEFNEEPNYKKIRDIFEKEIKKHGSSVNSPLEFQPSRKRRSVGDEPTPEKKTKEDEFEKTGTKPKVIKKKKGKLELNESVEDHTPEEKAKGKQTKSNKKEDSSDDEHEIKVTGTKKKKKEVKVDKEIEVMTDAMKEILAKKEKNASKKKKGSNIVHKESKTEENFDGYTEEMIEIQKKMDEKESKSKKKTDPKENGISKHTRPRRNIAVVDYGEH